MEGKAQGKSNLRVVTMCLGLVAGMAGLSYASVPLYELFCQVTGFGGTTQRAEAPAGPVSERQITVRFDANIRPELGWKFYPAQRSVTVRLGEMATAVYYAENVGQTATTGTASFNVTPQSTGIYFNKIACFCFTETTLQPGERIEMPVQFFVDPEIADHQETAGVQTITLSYTFFATEPKPVAARTGEETTGATGG